MSDCPEPKTALQKPVAFSFCQWTAFNKMHPMYLGHAEEEQDIPFFLQPLRVSSMLNAGAPFEDNHMAAQMAEKCQKCGAAFSAHAEMHMKPALPNPKILCPGEYVVWNERMITNITEAEFNYRFEIQTNEDQPESE